MGESKRGGSGAPSLIIFWLRSKSRRNDTKKRTTDRKVVQKLGTKKSYRLRQTHIAGFKMTHTARPSNIKVNHRRQILARTTCHPARWNDKTLALFDDFMTNLKNGCIMDDMIFDLYEWGGSDGNNPILKQRYQGSWLLVDDNSYLAWPTTVPPIKTTSSRVEIRFLSWIESMRKDVECTFGILKGRWQILKQVFAWQVWRVRTRSCS